LAIDLSCGTSSDPRALIDAGWTVLALAASTAAKKRLLAGLRDSDSVRLTVDTADFSALLLPQADLIYTGTWLPECAPHVFGHAWSRIVPAIRPGGWFVGRFLGDRDRRTPNPSLSFLTRKQVVTFLSGFLIELLRERENPSHEHVIDIVARRRPTFPDI
jgi:hypothetical protein